MLKLRAAFPRHPPGLSFSRPSSADVTRAWLAGSATATEKQSPHVRFSDTDFILSPSRFTPLDHVLQDLTLHPPPSDKKTVAVVAESNAGQAPGRVATPVLPSIRRTLSTPAPNSKISPPHHSTTQAKTGIDVPTPLPLRRVGTRSLRSESAVIATEITPDITLRPEGPTLSSPSQHGWASSADVAAHPSLPRSGDIKPPTSRALSSINIPVLPHLSPPLVGSPPPSQHVASPSTLSRATLPRPSTLRSSSSFVWSPATRRPSSSSTPAVPRSPTHQQDDVVSRPPFAVRPMRYEPSIPLLRAPPVTGKAFAHIPYICC